MSEPALLRFDGVALVRGGRRLFEGLNLSLGRGDALQVRGPNGAGKSSLLRLAAGVLTAERGTIERGRAALADDHLALDAELALHRALAFWAPRAAVEEALGAIGLGALGDVPVRYLSSGQRKRATLARVIASGAPLWLLDEPLNALDADGAGRLKQAIVRHRASGGAILAASHLPLPGEWRTLELAP